MDAYSPVFFLDARVVPDSDDDGGPSTRGGGLTSQQIQEVVDYHNKLRAGEGASNMEVMVSATAGGLRLMFIYY